jgi:hypothetical protein
MKTLYKGTRLIAAAIVATLVLSTGAAVALTKDTQLNKQAVTITHYEDLGRFVVTPKKVTYVDCATQDMGRFVVTQSSAIFVPAA